MGASDDLPILYRDLAEWWPLLSAPDDYALDARCYRDALLAASAIEPETMLELGSGGGNTASHLKRHFRMTLTDLSANMLEISRELNPECAHVEGDMRTLRLDREFDVVLVHDAIAYMRTEHDARRAIETAFVHCKPGGACLFAPDYTRETFESTTSHGGTERGARGLRYLEWLWIPEGARSSYVSDMVYVLREGEGEVRSVTDRHHCGLFAHDDWLDWIGAAGFEARSVPFESDGVDAEQDTTRVFLGGKPIES